MRKPQSNVTRGTPGMILLGFASLLLAATLVRTMSGQRDPETPLDETLALTALGDTEYYDALSENDFYNPVLVFEAEPQGIFRRTVNPVTRPDSHMLRQGLESTDRFFVYTLAHYGSKPDPQTRSRWFLKSGPNQYVEFGKRKYWPTFRGKP